MHPLQTSACEGKIVLREGATAYEFLHEFMHFRHSKKIGLQNYYDLGGYRTPGEVIKEKWVFDKLIEKKEIRFGRREGQVLDVYIYSYAQLWGIEERGFGLYIDAISGEPLYIIAPHGYLDV